MASSLRSPGWLWGLSIGLIVIWLLDITGTSLPRLVVAVGAAICLAGIGLWLLIRVVAAVGYRNDKNSARSRIGVAILALALVIRFVGIQFELTDHPRSDEGVYMATAERINNGDLFPKTFNYGHFLYYADALALWLQDTFPAPITATVSSIYGVETPFEVSRILLKCINALFGALTALAVFAIGRRVGGLAAGSLSALLITFSPVYNDISHEVISDVPAGFFATLTLVFVARLLDGEKLRDYLLAGIAAGLAAGSKYPGGVAAIAILGVWLYWRWKLRTWSWSLLWAAVTSAAAMIAVMPGLLLSRDAAFSGRGLDLFFGFRQYAFGGWLGVQPESAALWYGARILESSGLPALLLGVGGIAFLPASIRRRLLLVVPFPLFYLTLISSMSMVVVRNLQPALPMVAVVLGVGATGWLHVLRLKRPAWGRWPAFALGTMVLALPAVKTIAWDIAHSRPGTRQLARQWIGENVPDGISILREGYTSILDTELYEVKHLRFAAWMPDDELFSSTWDYLLLARNAHRRFLDPEALTREHERELAERYRRIFSTLDLVNEWRPSMLRAGAHLLLYRVEPVPPVYRHRRRFLATEATYVSDQALRKLGPTEPLLYTRRWQYAVFKDFFEAGRYLVVLEVDPIPEEGYFYVVTPDNVEIGTWDVRRRFEIELPQQGKYLFRLFLAPPARLSSWRLRAVDSELARVRPGDSEHAPASEVTDREETSL